MAAADIALAFILMSEPALDDVIQIELQSGNYEKFRI